MIRKGQGLGITRHNLHGQAWLFGKPARSRMVAFFISKSPYLALQPQMQHCRFLCFEAPVKLQFSALGCPLATRARRSRFRTGRCILMGEAETQKVGDDRASEACSESQGVP
jgi:hypothetical protein